MGHLPTAMRMVALAAVTGASLMRIEYLPYACRDDRADSGYAPLGAPAVHDPCPADQAAPARAGGVLPSAPCIAGNGGRYRPYGPPGDACAGGSAGR